MNRRNFLGLFAASVAGVALKEAIPLNRVWSFPSKIVIASPTTVRFIRTYDENSRKLLCRLDVLYGFDLLPTTHVLEDRIKVLRESRVNEAIEAMIAKHDIPVQPGLDELARQTKYDREIRGFWYEDRRD